MKTETLSSTESLTAENPSTPPERTGTVEPGGDGRAPARQQAAQGQIEVDDSNVTAGYANFCRVSATPEELILDLGLNPQPIGPAHAKVTVSQRVIMNHYTAKRLLTALAAALQRHEQVFGVLETDIRKRVKQ